MDSPIDALRVTLDDLLAWIRPSWHADAACRERPDLSWFPERGEPVDAARAVCRGCLVADECRATGIAGRESGIWGGLSERNRRQLRATEVRSAA